MLARIAKAFLGRDAGDGDTGPAEPAPSMADVIIVPQSAPDAWPDDPHPLVDAVVAFVNHMLHTGRYTRDELHPPAALQAYHCDFYLAQVDPIEPILAIGGGTMMPVGERNRMCFLVQTIRGQRWGVATRKGAAIFERIDHDNPGMPANPFEARIEQIANWRASEVGRRLSHVDPERVAMAKFAARKLQAGAALHLLAELCPGIDIVDFVTVRSAGPGPDGTLGLTLSAICNRGRRAASEVVTALGARLLDEPSHDLLVEVGSDRIADWARQNALPDRPAA